MRAGVRTTDGVASGPLILKRIARASTLLDRVHGAQGDFDRRSQIVATMINSTGLHAAKIVPLEVKDVRKFETKIVNTIWGPSRPQRVREIIFCLLCPGRRVSPTMLIAYQCALWVPRLCRGRGPALITAQAVWEANPASSGRGPLGRAVCTLQKWGWATVTRWWEWKAPGNTQHIRLTEHGPKLLKHTKREQPRLQCITQLIARRPQQFAGMDYTTCRALISECIQHFGSEQEKSLLRILLRWVLRTAQRAHQRGIQASPVCPYCQGDPKTEEHILWHCATWAHVRDPLMIGVKQHAANLQELPAKSNWPPCLKLRGLAPPLETFPAPLKEASLASLISVHTTYVAIQAARKLRDQQ